MSSKNRRASSSRGSTREHRISTHVGSSSIRPLESRRSVSRPVTERPFRSTQLKSETLQEEFSHQDTNTTDE